MINADELWARPSLSLWHTPPASPWPRAAPPLSASTLQRGSTLTAQYRELCRMAPVQDVSQCQDGLSHWGQHEAAQFLP